jgi:hypothetical protein
LGYFLTLIVVALRASNNRIRTRTTIVEFNERTFVSWQSEGHLPNAKWESLEQKTIFFEKGAAPRNVRRYNGGCNIEQVKKGRIIRTPFYRCVLNFEHIRGPALLHVVLPDMNIPDKASTSPNPDAARAVGSNITLTWTFEETIRLGFDFRKVEPAIFREFQPSGELICFPGDESAWVSAGEKLEEVGENIAAKTLAELNKPA